MQGCNGRNTADTGQERSTDSRSKEMSVDDVDTVPVNQCSHSCQEDYIERSTLRQDDRYDAEAGELPVHPLTRRQHRDMTPAIGIERANEVNINGLRAARPPSFNHVQNSLHGTTRTMGCVPPRTDPLRHADGRGI